MENSVGRVINTLESDKIAFKGSFFPFFLQKTIWEVMIISMKKIVRRIMALFLVTVFIPIVLALSLNCLRPQRVKRTVQTITYIPHFVSTVVLAGMMNQMLNPIIGLYGNAVQALTSYLTFNILIPSWVF